METNSSCSRRTTVYRQTVNYTTKKSKATDDTVTNMNKVFRRRGTTEEREDAQLNVYSSLSTSKFVSERNITFTTFI